MKKFDSKAINPKAFAHIDEYTDSFSVASCVQSDLMFGVPNNRETPWLSVVIPTFNRKCFFVDALESVLQQKAVSFCWEIIVVDNTPLDEKGSTPALTELRRIGDSRVSYYHNRENIGSGYNWNRGVELARGEWVCFLHDDDVLCVDALYNIGKQLVSYKGKRPLGYLHARRQEFSQIFASDSKRQFPSERLSRFGMLISGCTGAGSPTCGTVILKNAYNETGGINYAYGSSADAVLCYQIMKNYEVVCSNHILGGSRWSNNETLKKSVLLQLIQTDELLSRYTYRQTHFATWWGCVFGASSSWRNISRKRKIAEQNRVEITEDEFRASTTYPEPKIGKKILFLGIYAVYRLWRAADGWIHDFFRI